MYQTIVIPVSFEEDRDVAGATAVARTLADEGASITFLHVIQIIPVFAGDYIPAEVLVQNRERLTEKLEALTADVPGSRIALVDGTAGRGITDWATENHADCIVMASHTPAMSDLLLGSTAAWVVRHAPCAVHVIR